MFGYLTVFVDEINESVEHIIATVYAEATMAVCLTNGAAANCTYIVDGEVVTSTAELVSEVGIGGLLIDPLILQLPAPFSVNRATYADAGGPHDLVVHAGMSSVPVQPGVSLTAEPGQQFVIIELPAAAAAALPATDPTQGTPYSLELDLRASYPTGQVPTVLSLKALLALSIETNGVTYYPPMLPCTADLAQVPTLSINRSGSGNSFDLLATVKAALGQTTTAGCDQKVYDFTGSPTTTTIPGGESCTNCLDDDGDGLIDYEDADCCTGTTGTLALQRVRARTRKQGTRVALKGGTSALTLGQPPTPQPVVLQLHPNDGTTLCATIPSDRWRARKNGLLFGDPKRASASAAGLSRIRLRRQGDGSLHFGAKGQRSPLVMNDPGALRVTLAALSATGPAQCGSAVVSLTGKKGNLHYP